MMMVADKTNSGLGTIIGFNNMEVVYDFFFFFWHSETKVYFKRI